jgi:hypothetical protein
VAQGRPAPKLGRQAADLLPQGLGPLFVDMPEGPVDQVRVRVRVPPRLLSHPARDVPARVMSDLLFQGLQVDPEHLADLL